MANGVPKIALIIVDEAVKTNLKKDMKTIGDFESETFESLYHFRKSCEDNEYSGIIVDHVMVIESSLEDRQFYSQLCFGFPILRVSNNLERKTNTYLLEKELFITLENRELLDHFLNKECLNQPPHRVRKDYRKVTFLNTSLIVEEQATPIKTNLWDISRSGCFIIMAENGFKPGHVFKLVINELTDKTPIKAEVRWHWSWGKSIYKLPGYGLAFIELTDKQIHEIEQNIGQANPIRIS